MIIPHALTTCMCVGSFFLSLLRCSGSNVTMVEFRASVCAWHPFSSGVIKTNLKIHHKPNLLPGTLVFSRRNAKTNFFSFIKNMRIRLEKRKQKKNNNSVSHIHTSRKCTQWLMNECDPGSGAHRKKRVATRRRGRWIQISYHIVKYEAMRIPSLMMYTTGATWTAFFSLILTATFFSLPFSCFNSFPLM